MNAQEIIDFIANAEKKTPVKVYVNTTDTVDFGSAQVFGSDYGADRKGGSYVVFGDWKELGPILEANAGKIADYVVENDCRNSAVPLLDLKGVNARIEPGAIIRDKVEIGDGAVIMMGAILNIGAVVGKGTMIDMGTVLGGRPQWVTAATSGAGTVLGRCGGACVCHPGDRGGRCGHRRQRRGDRRHPHRQGRCGGRRCRGD